MKKCKYCGHIELSKQQLKIYRKLDGLTTTRVITDQIRINRKIIYQVLALLEKNGFVRKNGKIGKAILWSQILNCALCASYNWLPEEKRWSCKKLKGMHWYCNNFKEYTEDT